MLEQRGTQKDRMKKQTKTKTATLMNRDPLAGKGERDTDQGKNRVRRAQRSFDTSEQPTTMMTQPGTQLRHRTLRLGQENRVTG